MGNSGQEVYVEFLRDKGYKVSELEAVYSCDEHPCTVFRDVENKEDLFALVTQCDIDLLKEAYSEDVISRVNSDLPYQAKYLKEYIDFDSLLEDEWCSSDICRFIDDMYFISSLDEYITPINSVREIPFFY